MTESCASTSRTDSLELPVQLLDPYVKPLGYAHEGDAGMDIRSNEERLLQPGERALLHTGMAIAVPQGYAALVLPRSGLASKHGITVANAPGLIDSGYRGELMVALVNQDRTEPFLVEREMRIAQLVVMAVPQVRVNVCESLPESADGRGASGFGSSGVQ